MEFDLAIKIAREAILHTLLIASPVLVTSLLIGLIVSIFQTTTSIQEQTLTFVPKFVAIFMALLILGPFIAQDLMNLTKNLLLMIPDMIK
ncbi:MAG: flagellar biosynthesis protein FliQ [Spirochaetes bacterium]|nr:flagellar biosynthesis protein FliQ [Spirochaetota bacterium]